MKVTFWLFVALIFLLYGVIIFATGVYYWVTQAIGPNTAYHVSVWWGLLLMVVSVFFFRLNALSVSEQ